MNTIRFNHHYTKLDNIDINNPVTLIQATSIRNKHISQHFLEYDTRYTEWTRDGYGKKLDMHYEYYILPSARIYTLLHFTDINETLFTTLRRYTPYKQKRHRINVGQQYKVVME